MSFLPPGFRSSHSIPFYLKACLTLVLAAPQVCKASHYEVLTEDNKAPIQCLVQDLRHPQWTNAHYLACYSQYFSTKEGWGGYFYGGFVANPGKPKNLLQFCSWQMSGKGAPESDIDFAYAGKHMSWAKTTWEGSAGGIKGMWPAAEFKENEWHRFVARTWAPLDDPAHSFVGIWMKDVQSGIWHHLGSTRYPGIITNLNHFFGFQENFAGENADAIAHLNIRNTYSQRDGKWVADNKVLFRPQGEGDKAERLCLKTTEGGKVVSLETLWSYVKKATPAEKANQEFKLEKQQISYQQPAQPTFFDPVKIASLGAACNGSQLLVKWDLAADSCPQLGYKIEVFANASQKGEPLQVLTGNDPERRSLLIDAAFQGLPSVKLTLTDIYQNEAAPLSRTAVTLKPQPAKNTTVSAAGLNYRYYEAADKASWQALPDFEKLTPERQGVVGDPDISPRLRRTNYAFDFQGFLDVPNTGIYDFSLVFASGAKLIIDDQTVIDGDGYHSIGNRSGAVPLAAGKHTLHLQYVQGDEQTQQSDDFLQLLWTVPGASGKPVRIPTSAFSRQPDAGEPKITFTPPADGSGNKVKLAAQVSTTASSPKSIQYFMVDPAFDYFRAQGAQGGDYFIGETQADAPPLDAALWGSAEKTIRARLLYGKNRTIDSEPVTFKSKPADLGPWTLSELEHHQYPLAAQVDADSVTLVGESMGLLTRTMTGDCTLIARLADITPAVTAPDGSKPAANVWQAGIILRNDLDPSPGEPLGGKTTYAALIGCVDGSIRDCDSLMKNGAGNQPSGDRGGKNRWMKLQRSGNNIIESLSEDGKTWTVNKTVNLPKLGATIHAGLFIYALPSSTRLLHHASFDNISLTEGSGK